MLHRQNYLNLGTKIDQIFDPVKSLTIFNFINLVLSIFTRIFVEHSIFKIIIWNQGSTFILPTIEVPYSCLFRRFRNWI